MQIHDLVQGSPEWQQYRLEKFGASEAAAMLGISSLVKRTELLHMKATGTAQEFSDWVQKNILDYGHAVEALARPLAEDLVGTELYPVTCSAGLLSASCDGLTMAEDVAFEHKQWNEGLAASIEVEVLPDEYMPQCQQIMMVTKASKVLFVVSDGTPERFVSMVVEPDAEWQARISAGWEQFAKDLAEYKHVEVLPAPVAAAVQDLPALSIRVDGQLTLNHNLAMFGEKLRSFIADIDTNPSDDQAFADTEQAIKVMERAENALGAAEASALGQISTVDDMVRTVASYKELARKTRLMLEKVVKARKETIRVEIQQAGKDKAAAHIVALNARLGKPYMPAVHVDFAGVMKNKRTIASLRDAVDTELARFKIEANAVADKVQINLGVLRETAMNHAFLFADAGQIALKAPDDFAALVKLRIADHETAEAEKQATLRARIAEEEKEKAETAAAETSRLAIQQEQSRLADIANEQEALAQSQRDYERSLTQTPEVELRQAQATEGGSELSPAAQALNEHEGAQRFAASHPTLQGKLLAAAWPLKPAPTPTTPPTLRLGQINERIAPLSISVDGLRTLGFEPAARDKAAQLYHESQFANICAALMWRISLVQTQRAAA